MESTETIDGGARVRLATGPVSWGVDFADDPHNPPWPEVLDGIAASQLRWTELGPLGYLPQEPATLLPALQSRGLGVAGSFLFQPLHDPSAHDATLDTARRTCRLIRAAGGSHLVVLDQPGDERASTAGRTEAARRLHSSGWQAFLSTVHAVSDIARDEFDLRPVFHPHAGTYVEFQDEIERLLAATDPERLGLCIDTGHCAYAGVSPTELLRSHGDRVSYLHFKDVDAGVLATVRAQGLSFWTAIEREVFCPLGRGAVDFPGFIAELGRIGFDGYATIEQDRRPGASRTPLEDLADSVAFLRAQGLDAS
jgi:inosose dehydratase